MSTFSRFTASSQRVQLVLVACVSAAVTAGAILSFQQLRRQDRVQRLKDEIPDANGDLNSSQLTDYGAAAEATGFSKEDERSASLAAKARQGHYDEELILEQLARNRVFLTDDGLHKLRAAFVVVVGCGGVGSHAAAALARSGVSKLRLIDFDQVTLSSLNRHAVATLADVGTPKVQAIRRRLEAITPWVEFDCINQLFGESVAAQQLGHWNDQAPDFIVDAIDNIDSKVALLQYCHKHNLKVISSMGAGAKSDPTRIFIGDISSSTDDPLSKATRRKLRLLGVKEGIPVVFSTEKPGPGKASLLPLPDEELSKGNVAELGVLQRFRVRILPVLGTMPAIFGLAVANHVILAITGYPHEYIASKLRHQMYEAMAGTLLSVELRLARDIGKDTVGLKIPFTVDDVGYIVDEIFRGRSVVSGLTTKLMLIRWRKPQPGFFDDSIQGQKYSKLAVEDVVCMTKDEGAKHEKLVLKGDTLPEDLYEPRVVAEVKRRLQEEAWYARYR